MKLLNYAYPTNVRTVLSGLCYGAVLIALLFYPFPQILDKAQINPPQWVIGVILAIAFHDRIGTGALIAGLALLVIHTSGCIWKLKGNNEQ